MMTAREAAFRLLKKMNKDAAYSNLLLENTALLDALDQRERAFATHLVYGVTERMLTLDYHLSLYLTKPLSKLSPDVLCILRLGAFQLLFCEKVPISAAINESVKLAKKHCAYAAGLCNAVLRKVDAGGLRLPDVNDQDYLSVKYSCPQWLVTQWRHDYGEETAAGILRASFSKGGISVRVNTCLTTPAALMRQLSKEGVSVQPGTLPEQLLLTELPCRVDQLDAFQRGLFHVQDKASMLCAAAVGANPGETVFDLCAAPGGKTFSVAEMMENTGRVLAFDCYDARVQLIADGAKRLHLSCVQGAVGDAAVYNEALGEADRVLCDVPCSGLGIMRQKPEVKYKDAQALADLPKLQGQILENGARYVKAGGRLVYSTCALSKRENEDVCAAFLQTHAEFTAVPPVPALSPDVFLTLFPHIHNCDGFFIAAFQKEGKA